MHTLDSGIRDRYLTALGAAFDRGHGGSVWLGSTSGGTGRSVVVEAQPDQMVPYRGERNLGSRRGRIPFRATVAVEMEMFSLSENWRS